MPMENMEYMYKQINNRLLEINKPYLFDFSRI